MPEVTGSSPVSSTMEDKDLEGAVTIRPLRLCGICAGTGADRAPSDPKGAGLERLNWLAVTGYPWVSSQRNRDYESEGQRFESSWAHQKINELEGAVTSRPFRLCENCAGRPRAPTWAVRPWRCQTQWRIHEEEG